MKIYQKSEKCAVFCHFANILFPFNRKQDLSYDDRDFGNNSLIVNQICKKSTKIQFLTVLRKIITFTEKEKFEVSD